MVRAAVREVVAVHRSHDNVIQAEIFDDKRDVARLFRVQRQRLAFVKNVAVLLPQHSPIFGQRASSQTVWRFFSLRIRFRRR